MASADIFIGMTKKNAQNKAEMEGMIFRLIKVDNEDYLPYPDEFRDDRLCVEIFDGKVIKAIIQ